MKGKFINQADTFFKAGFALAFLLLAFAQCKKDPKPLDREKFIGTYNVDEACTSGTYDYTMTITTSSANNSDVVIGNFGDFGENYTATVSGSNISINDTEDGVTVIGNGSINGNTLSISYTTSGGFADDCDLTATK